MKNLSLNNFIGAYLKALNKPEGSRIQVNTDTGEIAVMEPNSGMVTIAPMGWDAEVRGPYPSKWVDLKFPENESVTQKLLTEAIEVISEIEEIYRDVRILNEIDSFTLQPAQVFLKKVGYKADNQSVSQK